MSEVRLYSKRNFQGANKPTKWLDNKVKWLNTALFAIEKSFSLVNFSYFNVVLMVLHLNFFVRYVSRFAAQIKIINYINFWSINRSASSKTTKSEKTLADVPSA